MSYGQNAYDAGYAQGCEDAWAEAQLEIDQIKKESGERAQLAASCSLAGDTRFIGTILTLSELRTKDKQK